MYLYHVDKEDCTYGPTRESMRVPGKMGKGLDQVTKFPPLYNMQFHTRMHLIVVEGKVVLLIRYPIYFRCADTTQR